MKTKLERSDVRRDEQINFHIYGVTISIRAEKISQLEEVYRQLGKVFPHGMEKYDGRRIEFRFSISWIKNGGYELYRNDEKLMGISNRTLFFEAVESQIRLTIAEFARAKVFLHAGVVGWKNRAIVIPARSFSGKSTLVAELIKKGAVYYSDEYAVLDVDGNVQPFPRWLSIRSKTPPFAQTDQPVESFGAVAGTVAIPVGLILIAKYDGKKKTPLRWQPKRLSGGQGMMEILPHTMPIRNKPKFVLGVLNKLVNRAIIVKTVRGEAAEFAETLLNYFEYQTP